jgi:hypothetical protein
MRVIYALAEELLVSQEGLGSMELDSFMIIIILINIGAYWNILAT